MHKIVLDRIHKLAELRMTGTAALSDILLAGAAMRQAVKSLAVPPGTHMSLYDLSGMPDFSDAALDEAFREWGDPRFTCVRARKIALVAPSAMSRRRLEKLQGARPDLNVFADRKDAMRWLFATNGACVASGATAR